MSMWFQNAALEEGNLSGTAASEAPASDTWS
jgi:hypothetical protein